MSAVRFGQPIPLVEKIAYNHDINGKTYTKSLNETMAKIRDSIAGFFFRSGRFFATPHWKITETCLNTVRECKNNETPTSKKVFLASKTAFSSMLMFPFAIAGLTLGQIFHFSGYLLSTKPYIHLKGLSNEKHLEKNLSFFQLNCCLTSGGFSQVFGGTTLPNSARVEKIAQTILENKPDLVCLQEVSDLNDAYHLYKKLSSEYSEFYFNMGPTPFILKNNSGLFVASKVKIENPELHSFSDIKGTEGMVNKCFLLFSTNEANFISTHLSPSKDDLRPKHSEIQTRAKEQERILSALRQRSSQNQKPGFVSGDFNINCGSDEQRESLLFHEGYDQYNTNHKDASKSDAATAESKFLTRHNWDHDKGARPQNLIIDYFLTFSKPEDRVLSKTVKIPTFDVNAPILALSDHAALMTLIKFS